MEEGRAMLDNGPIGIFAPPSSNCQSSSVVEPRTHKPLVGGSNPPSGTTFPTRKAPRNSF